MQMQARSQTVVGLFDDMSDAQRAVSQLESAGIPRNDINIVAGNESGRYSSYTEGQNDAGDVAKGAAGGAGAGAAIGGGLGLVAGLTALAIPGFGPIIAAGPIAAALTGGAIGAAAGGMIGGLRKAGVPDEHANLYAEGVRRGGVLVTVSTTEELADRAADILDSAGARDVDEKSREWGSSGVDTVRTSHLHDATHTSQPLETSSSTTMGDQGERAIPVVQEELRVGKRDVRRGGVRVFSEIREQPVQENVQLRDETIRVERRSVDRPIDTREFDAFREGTIELTETDEEAVVEKRARVKEEVVISKDVDTRTETIRDTVRSTDVRVENTGTTSNYDTDFRNDFTTRYAGRGHQYDRYQPAYEFGHRYASDQRYNNRDWSVVEPDLRRDWESRGHGTWEDFKDSIRYGWDKVRGRR